MKRDMSNDIKEEKLKGLVGRTHSLSPLAVLSRGYAVVSKDGKALKNTEGVSVGDEVELRLQNGKLIAEVTQVGKEN